MDIQEMSFSDYDLFMAEMQAMFEEDETEEMAEAA